LSDAKAEAAVELRREIGQELLNMLVDTMTPRSRRVAAMPRRRDEGDRAATKNRHIPIANTHAAPELHP